jgi:competence protein ComEC
MTLVYLGCAWLVGIYVGSWVDAPPWVLGASAAGCGVAALALRRRPRLPLTLVAVLAVFLGVSRYHIARPRLVPGPLAAYNGTGPMSLRGLVVNEPVPRDRMANLLLDVYGAKVRDIWAPLRGLVLVRVPSYSTYRYGDELAVQGQLATPSDQDGSSYRLYLARQGIHSVLSYPRIELLGRDKGSRLPALLFGVKRNTQRVIAGILPEPEAALLSGILLGSDEGIPTGLMDQFRATGTAHIIVISGFNIALISATLVRVFSRFLQRYVALVLAVAAIALYAVMVGAEPPVLRAAFIGGLAAMALIVGRRDDTLTSLSVAAWAMTMWQPFVLWDVGFQLSFAASIGLALYAEKLTRFTQRLLEKRFSTHTAAWATRLLGDSLLVTIAAQILVVPLILLHFGQFTPIGVLANLLVLPVQPTIVGLGGLAAMLGLVSLRLGQMLGWATWLFLTYTVRIVEWLARWVGVLGGYRSVHPVVPLAYYGLLALVTFNAAGVRASLQSAGHWLHQKSPRKAAVALLAVALILVWTAVASLPDGRLHVTFFDVGQGDAILVRTPSGRRVLIDGGPSPSTLLAGLGRALPFWDRRIDLVLLSHPHDDHLQGLLFVLQRYTVRQVLVSDAGNGSLVFQQWQQSLHDRAIPVLTVQQPLEIELGDGPLLQIVPPQAPDSDDLDASSLIARLTWQGTSFLFTGDLGASNLLELGKAGSTLASTILKVPHHGGSGSLEGELLAQVQPALAVISVGADNRFGHPDAATLQVLDEQGVPLLRTDQAGDIEVIVGHEGWKVKTERRLTD